MGRQYPIILIVDDSQAFREFAQLVIKDDLKFVTIITATNGMEGLQMYKKYKPDVIILDWKMPVMDGMQVLKTVMKDDPRTKVIMTTAYTEDQLLLNEMKALGALCFVPKPTQRLLLLKAINDGLRERKNAGLYGQIPNV
ncbi:response regulator transcription factor [Candidatus Nitrosarchaeum limnium]|uniref:Putative chemotaxis protein Chey n=1 Tax=Candidatus Nitrosarchaeum limnium BG20 TaxID=859192 RepID=S2E4U3_9ARCH|nr:response regulator transcription factor [Candidatus Nitrosarchaeum limnium]EPA05783.1 putative chemotaxis protein Chey [Candidatus Nitrosarchaeum limnium BG20]